MGKVDKKNKPEQDKDSGTYQCNVVAPKDEEAIWYDERDYDEYEPYQDLRAPPAIRRSLAGQIHGYPKLTHSEGQHVCLEYP